MKDTLRKIVRTMVSPARKAAISVSKPLVKKFLVNAIAEYRDEALEALKENVDIPKLEAAEEEALWSSMYDALAPAVSKIIDRI